MRLPCHGLQDEALYESEAFGALKDALVGYALPKNIANLKTDLGKYRIQYDVWFPESTLHASGAVKGCGGPAAGEGRCYKAEGTAPSCTAAPSTPPSTAPPTRRRATTAAWRRTRTRSWSVPTASPPTFAADIAYHYNKLAERGFDKAHRRLGALTTTAMWPA